MAPRAALLADRVDIALVCNPDGDPRLRYWPVMSDELVAIVAPDHEWVSRPYVGVRELANEHLILAPVAKGQGRLAPLFAAAGVVARSITRIPMTEAILEMAREGVGVDIVPQWTARTYLAAGLVRSVRITRTGLTREWRAAARQTAAIPAHVSDFVAILRRSLSPSVGRA
jgi:LysR family transcriptional regulator for metE and metH